MKIYFLVLFLLQIVMPLFAQDFDEDKKGYIPLAKGLEYDIEMQSTFSEGRTPLWLNANKYGLSSLDNPIPSGDGGWAMGWMLPFRTISRAILSYNRRSLKAVGCMV